MSQHDYDIHIPDPISDIMELILACMAMGFIAVIVVKVFRARNGEGGLGDGDGDGDLEGGLGHEMVD